MIKIGFRFDTAKKDYCKSLGNSSDIADQITGLNSLGIPRGNLELEHMSIIS